MTDPAMRQTALYESHVALGARMVEFGGWLMPVQYDGIVREHERTRTAVSMFDTCHMGQVLVSGANATSALQRVLTADVDILAAGVCRYGFLLNERGGVVDDLITCRRESGEWLLVVNAGTRERDVAWLRAHLPADVTVKDLSPERGKIDVQGPDSMRVVSRVIGTALDGLRFFRLIDVTFRGKPLTVSRTGYTGERGYELYADTDTIRRLWNELLAAGVHPAGLGARDTLRLEAGLPLYGHELTEDISPLQANLGRFAAKEAEFIGRAALVRERRDGVARRLTGFRLADRQAARAGCRILSDGVDVGWVTSGSYAPTVGCAIGMAYVRTDVADSNRPWTMDIGRKRLAAEPATLPFYRSEALI